MTDKGPNRAMVGEQLLVDATGTHVVKRYLSLRPFGRIQHDGRWFTARRLHDTDMPENIYIEEGSDG